MGMSSSGSPGSVRDEQQVSDERAPDTVTSWSSSVGWGLALLAAGAVWLAVLLGVPVDWELVLPAALVVVGVLVLTIGRRGAEDGLIGLGVVLAIVTLVVWWAPGTDGLSAGERTYEVTDVAELEPSYGAGVGTLTLDLRDLDLSDVADGVTEITGRLGMGELQVLVPEGVTVTGRARVGMGEAAGFGRSSGGIAPSLVLSDEGDADGQVLDLDLQVGLGQIEVER